MEKQCKGTKSAHFPKVKMGQVHNRFITSMIIILIRFIFKLSLPSIFKKYD